MAGSAKAVPTPSGAAAGPQPSSAELHAPDPRDLVETRIERGDQLQLVVQHHRCVHAVTSRQSRVVHEAPPRAVHVPSSR